MASYDELALRFKALAHPVRLQILDMLRGGELCVCHIETALDKRQARFRSSSWCCKRTLTLRKMV
jgi:DNA-binding transcriptional ArsR family regulator